MRKYLYWLLAICWIGVIFYVSGQPYEKQDIKPYLSGKLDLSFMEPLLGWISFSYNHAEVSVVSLGINGFIEFFIRKGTHVAVFFLLLCFFYLALKKACTISLIPAISISFFLTVAYAILDEFHQGFTSNRTAYIGDVFIDSFGALLAVFLLLMIHKVKIK